MDDLLRVRELVLAAASQLSTPVSVKIRLFPELAQTIEYATMLQEAGASLLAVHGRTREMKVCAQGCWRLVGWRLMMLADTALALLACALEQPTRCRQVLCLPGLHWLLLAGRRRTPR